jgi:hypothetical protein
MATKKTEPAPVEVIDIADPKPEPKAKSAAAQTYTLDQQMVMAAMGIKPE